MNVLKYYINEVLGLWPFGDKEAMSLHLMGIVVSAARSLLYRVFTLLPLLHSLGVWPYPWTAQRTGGQAGGGSTDTPGSVSRINV